MHPGYFHMLSSSFKKNFAIFFLFSRNSEVMKTTKLSVKQFIYSFFFFKDDKIHSLRHKLNLLLHMK